MDQAVYSLLLKVTFAPIESTEVSLSPVLMIALYNSESENKFAILSLPGGSSRLPGCHGI